MRPSTTTRSARQHSTDWPAISESDICAWLGQAAPQDSLVYHRGFLALDRSRAGGRLREQDAIELSRVAGRAWFAAEQGIAHLVQHRNGCNDFSYVIVARPRPKAASVSLSELLAEQAP